MNPLHLEQNDVKTEREMNKSRESNVSVDSNRASFRNSHHKRKESLIESAGARTSMSIIPSLLHSKDDKNIEPLLGRFHREL